VGLFNRMFLGLAASRDENQRFLTPEVPQLFSLRRDALQGTAEVKLTGAIYAFGTARETRLKNLVKDTEGLSLDPSLLDRTEWIAREGIRWRPRSTLTFGLGLEQSRTEFDRDAADSSNEGTAPVLEVQGDGNRIFFGLDAAARSLSARQGSRFVSFDGVTGSANLSFRPYRHLELWVYGNRNLTYSLLSQYPYLDDRRVGLSLHSGGGERLSANVFFETGTNEYKTLSASTPGRSDDVRSYGGVLRFVAADQVTFAFQVMRSRFTSNLPGNDRSYTAGGVTVTLGNDLF
jgi:hypothetical protein